MEPRTTWSGVKLWVGRVLVLAVVVALVITGVEQWRLEAQAERRRAAAWVGQVSLEHLQWMGGQWPTSWVQLADTEEFLVTRQRETNRAWLMVHQPKLHWVDLPNLVELEFAADTSGWAKQESTGTEPPIRVIRLLTGEETDVDRTGPNWRLWEWARKRAGKDAGSEEASPVER